MSIRLLFFSILLTGTALALWAFVFEPWSFRIRTVQLNLSDWPEECEGTSIAVLADLHVGSPYKGLPSLRALVEEVNRAQPDLVLLPGDFVIQGVLGGSFVTPEAAGAVLATLTAPMGVYAVLGNHDWWLDATRVETALSDNAIGVLSDESTVITAGNCRLRLAGISDFMEGPADVSRALSAVTPGDTVLAFTHNPDVFPQIPDRVALTVAGHTHGGQVYFPGIGRLIVPSRFGERYAIGHVIETGRHLYVSPGVGTSILPVRFLVPPEVSLLRITSGAE